MKVIYPFIKNAKKELEQRLGEECRIEYSNYAYDIVCGKYIKKYYKVKRLKKNGAVPITYAEYLDAREVIHNLYLLVVNGLGKILLEIPFKNAVKIFYGILNEPYIRLNEKIVKIKPRIVPGRNGVLVPVFVKKKEWETIRKKLSVIENPVEYLKRKLVD